MEKIGIISAVEKICNVIEGAFQLEIQEELISVEEGKIIIVPKGVRHRPVATSLALSHDRA